jgi:RNA polymerase sigma-70 factor (ECF subfamily)
MKTSHFDSDLSSLTHVACTRQDDRLVLAAQAGCAAAFAELRERYSPRIYRTIFAITKNREDAEDALQDSFLRAYLALHSFEGRANFSSWLTRIAINCSLMILRKRRARPEVSLNTSPEAEDDMPPFEFKDTAPNPEQSYVQRQRYLKLLRSIRKLTPNLREVVEIRGMRECSVKETAQLLEISEAATKSRLYRARTRLTASRAVDVPVRRNFSARCPAADEVMA